MRLLTASEVPPPPQERHLSPRTKVVLSVSAWASLICVVAGASFSLGIKANALSRRFDVFNRRFANVLTRHDLQEVKRDISHAFLVQFKNGTAWANCPKFETRGEKRSHCKLEGLVLPTFPPIHAPEVDDVDDVDDVEKPKRGEIY